MNDKPRHRVMANMGNHTPMNKSHAFGFGEPERVLSSPLVDYLGVSSTMLDENNEYYTPPIPLRGLAKVMNANAHHGSAIHFKTNLLAKGFKPSDGYSMSDFKKAAFEKVLFGQFYLQRVHNRWGKQIGVRHIPGIPMRRIKGRDQYAIVRYGKDPVIFDEGEIIHYKNYDPLQSIYGTPEYLGGLQSILLNENATLFRRRYYENGNHAGFIFYTADPDMDDDDADELQKQISGTKGVGNFRSMFLNIPNGKEKSVQIIPIGDISQKDEFERIKNVTRNDILSSHRIHRELAAVMPEEGGGSGDIKKISQVCHENEVIPMQNAMQEINPMLPKPLRIAFEVPNFEQ